MEARRWKPETGSADEIQVKACEKIKLLSRQVQGRERLFSQAGTYGHQKFTFLLREREKSSQEFLAKPVMANRPITRL